MDQKKNTQDIVDRTYYLLRRMMKSKDLVIVIKNKKLQYLRYNMRDESKYCRL